MFRIRMLGPFQVLRDGEPIPSSAWRSQQTRTILKVLLTRRGRVVPADQLLEILWPKDDPDAGRKRLHVRISQLRRALDPDGSSVYIMTAEGTYAFNPEAECWLDVAEFEAQAERGRQCQEDGDLAEAVTAYEAASGLYRGDFLEEDLYEDWAFAERERLRERFLTVLTELAECYAQQGRYRRAIAHCRRVLSTDPCREAVYARLMLYHYYAGEQAQALRAYERCCRALAEELGVEPMPATAVLAEQIRDGSLWATGDVPRYPPPAYEGRLFEVPYSLGRTPFVGREREYAWLVEQWRNPETSVLLIEGEAGVGKSRLVNEFLGYVATEGATVVRSRMALDEGSVYAPVVTALRSLLSPDGEDIPAATLAALAPLFPVVRDWCPDLPTLPELPARQERDRLFAAVETLVRARTLPGAVLCVDDAHRASAVSLELLAHLARSVVVVLVCRNEETPSDHPLRLALQPLRRQGRVATLTLDRLAPVAVRALVRQLARGDLPDLAERVIAQTDGNPLFVVALLQHVFEEGALFVDVDGRWAIAGDVLASLPPTVRETIEARLRRLNREQRRVFDLATVIGGEFDFVLLQAACREGEGLVLDRLDALLEVGVLVEPRTAGRREFALAHDRYAEVAYDTLPQVRRRQLHRRVGEAIEKVHAVDLTPHHSDLAYHYGRAEDTARELFYVKLAGEQAAAQFANAKALAHLGRALDLTPEEDVAERYELLLTRERVYDVQGEREAQAQDLKALEELADILDDDRRRAEIALRRSSYVWVLSDFAAAAAAAEMATNLARKSQAVGLEAASLLQWGRSLLWYPDPAWQVLKTALALVQAEGLRWEEAHIVRMLGVISIDQGDTAGSADYFEQALCIHREVGDRRGEASALNSLGMVSQVQGDHATAGNYYGQCLSVCREVGDKFMEGIVTFNLGATSHYRGDDARARVWLERSLAIRREIDDREGEGETLQFLGHVSRCQGDYAEARAYCEQALHIFAELGDQRRQGRVYNVLGLIDLDRGSYAEARSLFERSLSMLPETESHKVLSSLGLLCHYLGDDETACEYSRRALSAAQGRGETRYQEVILTNLGHALASLGRLAEAGDAYQQARDLRCDLEQDRLTAGPLAGLACVALAQGDLTRAQEYVDDILASFEAGNPCDAGELFRIRLTCHRVLKANEDPRAQEVLAETYNLLQQRAAAIEDEAMRCLFLENVVAHREIVELWEGQ